MAAFLNFHFLFHTIYKLEVFLSQSRCPRDVAMLGGRCFKNCLLLRPGHVRNFPLFIAFSKVLGIGLKQHIWRYWVSSVFVLSLVMIDIALCLTGIDIGMSYRLSVVFLCPFKIIFFPLRIWILLLSKIEKQSSSHSWHKEIREALCKPSKMCAFFAWALRLIARGMFTVHVKLIVSLFGNWTVGPSLVFCTVLSNVMYSVRH